jgi:hypothetical protein
MLRTALASLALDFEKVLNFNMVPRTHRLAVSKWEPSGAGSGQSIPRAICHWQPWERRGARS